MVLDRTEETYTRLTGDWSSPEADRLQIAWLDAIGMYHKLPDNVRYMLGMSGRKYRYLINNLVSATPNASYLEIGSWQGSTACSAMYGNKCKITCIDNWVEFGGPRTEFFQHVEESKNPDVDFSVIEKDFRSIDYSTIGKHNIYMFDGPHLYQDQYDGVTVIQAALDDTYTLVVDDYNVPHVQSGTQDALRDLGHTVVASIEIVTRHDNIHPKIAHADSDWHDGYYIAVIKKK
jgi:hypothetical protein